MPKYKEFRGERGQKEIVDAIRLADKRVDVSLYSKYENGVCLPTPLQAEAICEYFDCAITDLYERKEISLAHIGQNKALRDANPAREANVYKLTVRVNDDVCKWLKDALKACGYRGVTDWVTRQLEILRKRYEKKRAAQTPGRSDAAKKENGFVDILSQKN